MTTALRRYTNTPILGFNKQYGTSYAIPIIRENITNGNIKTKEIILKEAIRLDTLAGIEYGDGRLFWLIAIASGIGWGMAIQPGTVIKIPNINDVAQYIG